MKISCPECNEIYSIKESMIPKGGVKTRCKVCKTPFRIHPLELVDLDTLLVDDEERKRAAVEKAAVVEKEAELPAAQPVSPAPEPVAAAPVDLPEDEEEEKGENVLLTRLKSFFAEVEMETLAIPLALVIILLLCFLILQMENERAGFVPPPAAAIERGVDEEMMGEVAEEAAMPLEMEVEVTTTPEMVEYQVEVVEVEARLPDEVPVEVAEVEAPAAPEPVALPPPVEEEPVDELTAISTQYSLYSTERHAALLEQLGVSGEGGETAVVEAEVVEAAQPEKIAETATAAVATPVVPDAAYYSVERFQALMATLEQGGDVEEVDAADPVPVEVDIPNAKPAAPVASVDRQSLYSRARFETLMQQIEAGEEIETSAEAEAEPAVSPPSTTEVEDDDPLTKASTAHPLYSTKRFEALMKELEGE